MNPKTDSLYFNNYIMLCDSLKKVKNDLMEKNKKIFFCQYIVKTFPLYMMLGFFYFLFLFIFSCFYKEESINLFNKINKLILNPEKYRIIESIAIVIFFFQWIIISFFIFLNKETLVYKSFLIITINLSIILFFIFLFCFSSKFEPSSIIGLLFFTISTFYPTIIDRISGYTRRYERYQYYINKIERLIILNMSRKKLNIPFSEQTIIESMQIIDSLGLIKYNDTINDKLYLLNQLEKFKS